MDISDEGVYTCLADNGRGVPAEAEITLAVDSPTEVPASIVAPEAAEVVLSLGSPAHLNCLAYGYPKPTVTWQVFHKCFITPSLLDTVKKFSDQMSLRGVLINSSRFLLLLILHKK